MVLDRRMSRLLFFPLLPPAVRVERNGDRPAKSVRVSASHGPPRSRGRGTNHPSPPFTPCRSGSRHELDIGSALLKIFGEREETGQDVMLFPFVPGVRIRTDQDRAIRPLELVQHRQGELVAIVERRPPAPDPANARRNQPMLTCRRRFFSPSVIVEAVGGICSRDVRPAQERREIEMRGRRRRLPITASSRGRNLIARKQFCVV